MASKLHNDKLAGSNTDKNNNEHIVIKESAENIDLIVDHSAVYQVEDLHHGEYIKYVGHLSARALVLCIFAPKWSSIPV
jgi:nitrogenase molybdenum-iron protein alpha/beta subunit